MSQGSINIKDYVRKDNTYYDNYMSNNLTCFEVTEVIISVIVLIIAVCYGVGI